MYKPEIVSKSVGLCVFSFSHCPGTIMAPANEAAGTRAEFLMCRAAAAGGAFPCQLVAHAAGDGDEMSFTYYLPSLSLSAYSIFCQ